MLEVMRSILRISVTAASKTLSCEDVHESSKDILEVPTDFDSHLSAFAERYDED
jgi:hypothetical protein